MKKSLKIAISIIAILIIVWGVIFFIDYSRCSNFKEPIFVVAGVTADDGGSGTYYGLGYNVKVEKIISAEYGPTLVRVEMYMFDKFITGAIADPHNDSVDEDGKDQFVANNKEVLDRVSMSIKEGALTNATIVIKNTSNKELTSGEWFRIDRVEENGEWEKVKSINEEYGFIAIAWVIKPRGEFEDKIDWSKLYGELKKGNYRIVKEVYEKGEKIELYAEFSIK